MRAAAIFCAAFLYFFLFRFYGFQVEDEGTLLFQLHRVVTGQLPYIDFHTGYTPGFFYLGAALLHAFSSTATIRPVLALLNAASVAGLYAVAKRVVGPWLAMLPPLAWMAFLPIYREFASFNVPYPAWFATAAWVAVALALTRWVDRGGRLELVGAGFAAALAFAVKPNAGAFALAAATWLVSLAGTHRNATDWIVGAAASVVMLAGVVLAFGLGWWSVDAAIHLAPIAVIALACAFVLPGRLATGAHPRAAVGIACLALGFTVPTALWVVPFLHRLGTAAFARDVLLLGSPAAALYYLPHPPPQFYAVVVVAAACAIAIVGRAVSHGRLGPTLPLLAGVLVIVSLLMRLRTQAIMPESLVNSIGSQLENAGYWLAPLAHWGGIAYLIRVRTMAVTVTVRRVVALVPLATAMYLQLYPRTDAMHLIIAVPLTMILATALLERVIRFWTHQPQLAGMSSRAVVHALVGVAVAGVLVARFGAALDYWWESRAQRDLLIDTPTIKARAEPGTADDLAAFGDAAAFLRSHTTPGEPVLAFPALTGLLFATQLTSPVPHDYWYPGRPDHDDEAAMVATLRTAPPRFIATLNDGWTFFIDSPPYFRAARSFALEQYRLVARFGRFDILGRRDVASTIVLQHHEERGPAAAAIEPDLGRRRQAVRRWMAALTVDEATHAVLDDDVRAAILRLRAIRDGGDVRAAGWLIAGYRSAHPRIHEEALGAMQLVTAGLEAARYRWAGDFDPAALRSYVAPYVIDVEALRNAPDVRARDFARALLSLTTSGHG